MKTLLTQTTNKMKRFYILAALFLVSVQGEVYAQTSSNTTISNLEKGVAIGFKAVAGLVALVSLLVLGFKFFSIKDENRGEEGTKIVMKFVMILAGCAIVFGAPDLIDWFKNLSQGNA